MLQPRQLALQIALDDAATFDNFHVTAANRALLNYLQEPAALAQFTWLWGAPGAGCSHLLQAMCQQDMTADGVQPWAASFYVPLRQHDEWHPDILLGLESLHLICLDDVDAIAGRADWEQALFHLFNRLRDSGTRLLVAARTAPREAAFVLPDLLSRLQSGVVFQVLEPDDEDKLSGAAQAGLASRAGVVGGSGALHSAAHRTQQYRVVRLAGATGFSFPAAPAQDQRRAGARSASERHLVEAAVAADIHHQRAEQRRDDQRADDAVQPRILRESGLHGLNEIEQ